MLAGRAVLAYFVEVLERTRVVSDSAEEQRQISVCHLPLVQKVGVWRTMQCTHPDALLNHVTAIRLELDLQLLPLLGILLRSLGNPVLVYLRDLSKVRQGILGWCDRRRVSVRILQG